MDGFRGRRMDWRDVLALDDPPDSESARGDLDDRAADQEQSRRERDMTREW